MQGASEGLVCPYITMFVKLNGAMTSEGVIFLWDLNVANNQITIIVEMLCSGESPNGNEVYNVVHAQVVKRVLFTNLLSEI